MALIDLHQLVVLYKLRHEDACTPPTPPHLSPMVATPVNSLRFKLSERDLNVHYDILTSTPHNHGASVRKKVEGNTDRDEGCNRIDYDQYIREDLHSRVFVDFEAFIKSALHVPHDWKTAWRTAIETVKEDQNFKRNHEEYCKECDRTGSHESTFYDRLVNTANAVLGVVCKSNFVGISGTPQYYRVNDPKKIYGGVINKFNLSPDVVVLHENCKVAKGKNMHWANPLHVLEVKPYDGAICDGTKLPRLLVDGEPSTDRLHG